MRSGEAAEQAEENYKPLPLDAQFAYDRKYTDDFDGKTPEWIEEWIDRKRHLSISDLKGLKVYITNRFHSSQLEAEDAIQKANHARKVARNLRVIEHKFRRMITYMNNRIIKETCDHISYFMETEDFNQKWRDLGQEMLSDVGEPEEEV